MPPRTSKTRPRSRASIGPWMLSVEEQLLATLRSLRRKHTNLLGIGIGRRQCNGKTVSEVVVRLVVRTKPKVKGRLPKGQPPLPGFVPVWTNVLGQRIGLMMPTDIEQAEKFLPCWFEVGKARATSLAYWNDASGARHIGAITCAHSLPAAGKTVEVALRTGIIKATVVVRADLRKDGLDAGLVKIACDPKELFNAGPQALPIAGANDLLKCMGDDDDDALQSPVRFWTGPKEETSIADIAGVAFYAEHPIQTQGGTVAFRNVVEAQHAGGCFEQGQSGSAWALYDDSSPRSIIAIQSHMNPSGTRALGTHMGTALDWLKAARPDLQSLTPFWTLNELPVS
ncbi:MAG: hypothetical protein H7210_08425 [Pyrinomonadaceae bacterium]|nr:hypothetical protein [Phycisphaerales bacterium]